MFSLKKISQQFPTQGIFSRAMAPFSSLTFRACVGGISQQQPTFLSLLNSKKQVDDQRRHRSNRSRRHLYDGKDIRTGNNLSFSMKHTKRKFKPNVFIKRVYSESLDEMVRFHLTTSALRSIDKLGGLDNYLLSSPHVTSGEGLKVKKRIINRLKLMERIASGNSESGSSDKVAEAK
jgi:large subunit ribosomal protein L28